MYYSFYGEKYSDICRIDVDNFILDSSVNEEIDKILGLIGLPHNFVVVPCSDIENAFAYTSTSGMRYIVYDPEFIKKVSNLTSDWSSMFILAHEIAHHLCGHTLDNTVSISKRISNELEADKFSGFILYKLGANIDQATAAIELLTNNNYDKDSWHPTKDNRLQAIKSGYQNASKNYTIKESIDSRLKTDKDFVFYFWLGYMKQEKGEYKQALEMYQESLRIKETSEAYNNMGSVYLKLNEPITSIVYFYKSISLDKNNFEAHNGCGIAFSKLKQYDNAIIEFNNAIYKSKHDYDLIRVYTNRGVTYTEMKRYNDALKDFNLVLSYSPNNANALFCRGGIKILSGDKKNGCIDLKKSCQLNYEKACDFLYENCN